MRTRPYYFVETMFNQFRNSILSVLDFNTGAVYRASSADLASLMYVSPESALEQRNLAPLGLRRDIAMLGLLRTIRLNESHVKFHECSGCFEEESSTLPVIHPISPGLSFWRTATERAMHFLRRSNSLPATTVAEPSMKLFQCSLMRNIRLHCSARHDGWQLLLSPRREYFTSCTFPFGA